MSIMSILEKIDFYNSTIPFVFAAQEALEMRHPMVKMRPISQASHQTKVKAKKACGEYLLIGPWEV